MGNFKYSLVLCLLLGLLVSCIQDPSVRNARSSTSKTTGQNTGSGGSSGSGNNAGPGENGTGNVGTSIDDILKNGRVEIRHIVNPTTGTYESKVSIPKNFTGTLYLSGLNVASLANRNVWVRFKFGRELEAVTVPATIARASGLTPQTDMEVVILRMRNRPFENIRLLYDLYDYNQYTATGTPVTDPKNVGLYCRGLKLEHDPTFQGNLSNSKCDAAGERCLYAYAKVVDSGLYLNGIAKNPTTAQLDSSATTYASYVSTAANAITKCLPDNGLDVQALRDILGATATTTFIYGSSVSLGGTDYLYQGPYRLINYKAVPNLPSDWQISGGALFSDLSAGAKAQGLFQKSIISGDPKSGYKSFLFPLAAKRSLRANVQYFGSSDPFGNRSLTYLTSSGQTEYMDGCNARLVDENAYSPESISACNVSGMIEILHRDPTTGAETVLASTSEIKLQLVRASEADSYGDEVIYSSMNSCNNSYACGSEQCCFNNRCWSKNYVSQCAEDVSPVGNGNIGTTCKTDYDCTSLCCNQSTNTCQVHINTESQQVLCSKAAGQQCVAKEWCAKVDVIVYKKIKTGIDPITNKQLCRLQPYNVPTFSDCRNGVCVPPAQPTPPSFDATNPDCSDAIDAP